ncbi:MAG: excinuclease ABC subunit UvrC [Cyclobacteriaceae bacterium]|nr:excinuclease ABC subunit UvrC [Cyclobacteriaceae bacterium]MCB0499169.1 excinuclease ABC subunit C [Cyclobacteriaceae bacterium]MCB9237991.1 excinuclease ABC subunit C [Flammeovirgaceae bacterium]MCW5901685.1 excinuclease ABC subunit UvrC [Cyclobacteriaceae bacterium]
MKADALKDQVASLPDAPGIYKFFNADAVLIYVGKAKNLKKRVGSYFTKQSQYNRKTEKLVSEIQRIDYTITNSEFDALLLENNFIKQNQPKYNILLKDDKTFPYLCILNERFPRIISTRKYQQKKGEYFGPYTSVVSMNSVLALLRQLYTIRTCNLLLSEVNIRAGKFKVCLEYHLGNCKGPCEGLQEESDYNQDIEQARHILKGNLSVVIEYFTSQMKTFASKLEFEKAEQFKNKLTLLEKFQTKSLVVNKKLTDIDVFTITSSSLHSFVNFMQVKEGAIIFSENIEVRKKLEENDEDVLSYVAHEVRSKHLSHNQTVFSNLPISIKADNVDNFIPRIGDKKKLIELSLKNALYQRRQKEIRKEEAQSKNNRVLSLLMQDLRLKQFPNVIECFDNSNLQGTHPVASMVRFVNGKPDKAGYRHFNIKTVVGPDDFASMKEVVLRRYGRLVNEGRELPDLIIVDGGKGQLSHASEALKELHLYGRVPIIGIAKRLEEIYYPEDSLPLHINKKSAALMLIQRIRDEAHRFAITFHRQKRSKAALASEVASISGIGEKTAGKLLQAFKSWKKIKEANLEELAQVVGKSKAEVIERHKKGGL